MMKKENTTLFSNSLKAKNKLRRIFSKLILYFLLFGIGIVFIYPILYMIVNSLKTVPDLVNPMIEWVPSYFYIGNYERAIEAMDYFKTLGITVGLVLVFTLAQTVACSLAGYSFARHNFPFKNLWFVLVIAVFLIPVHVTLIPRYLQYTFYGLAGSPLAILLPALFGQGLNSSIFILVFYQFFSSYPTSFDEAAQLDGASRFKVFWKIALPICTPAIVVTLLFSFVWFWNETYMSGLLMGAEWKTLPMKLKSFADQVGGEYASAAAGLGAINESSRLAETFLVISPLIVLYLLLQRQFIEGIETTGLTGE